MALEWHGEEVAGEIASAVTLGIKDAMENILHESNKTVPLETGDLQHSGFTDAEGNKGSVYYSSPYAVVQHENLDFQHAPGRRAKFLEIAVHENESLIPQFIADRIKEELNGTG